MFRRLSIGKKVALILWGTCLLVVGIASVVLVIYQSNTLERRARDRMESYARLISVGVESAVDFADKTRAQKVLDTLRANPEIIEAEVRLENGEILANYPAVGEKTTQPYKSKADGVYINHERAELFMSLKDEEDIRARLHLTLSLNSFQQQGRQIFLAFGIALLILLVAITLSQLAVLQHAITRPIRKLAASIDLVRGQNQLHQRRFKRLALA